MSLNIKNEETHRLVRALAERTGQSQTAAVEQAVRRQLDELATHEPAEDRNRRIDEVVKLMQSIAAADPAWLATDWDTELYDENGLPR